MLLVHVDDVMLMGDKTYVQEIVLPLLQKKFYLSCELLRFVGDSASFLRRLYTRVDDCNVVKPSTYFQRMFETVEEVAWFVFSRFQQMMESKFKMVHRS
jgi:hypothetical protein